MKSECYDKIEEDGLTKEGERVKGGDVIIGKTSVIPSNIHDKKKITHKDHSQTAKNGESGIVDKVMLSTNHDGYRFVKVRVRSVKIPEPGDKFSSRLYIPSNLLMIHRHGQKGVVGRVVPQEDLPFNAHTKIYPDIIVNPHAFPSR
jgi:DNA-directed RNA polymerase II subunit RPB2